MLIETKGDVSTICPTGQNQFQKEIKHHFGKKNLGDRDDDFLNTLDNWCKERNTMASYKERVRFLPTVNDNTGEIVMERLKQMFYRRFPNSNVLLSYRIAPLSTQMGEEKTETPASEHNG